MAPALNLVGRHNFSLFSIFDRNKVAILEQAEKKNYFSLIRLGRDTFIKLSRILKIGFHKHPCVHLSYWIPTVIGF